MRELMVNHGASDAAFEDSHLRRAVEQVQRTLRADAASLFLFSDDLKHLRGALVGWDWTRTSFVQELVRWPSVREALGNNRATFIDAISARDGEREWFEDRGIRAAICAPMSEDERVYGVMFFDYLRPLQGGPDLTLAKVVADRCGQFLAKQEKREDMHE